METKMGGGVKHLILACIVLSAVVVATHLGYLGPNYLATKQFQRHLDVLSGTAGNPWCYRLLPEWLVGLNPSPYQFIGWRYLATIAVFLLCLAWWRRWLDKNKLMIGVILLAFGATWMWFDSDLSIGTWIEGALCLGFCILSFGERGKWFMLPFAILAALNRETSGLVLLLLAVRPGLKKRLPELIALGLFILTTVILRVVIGPHPYNLTYGCLPGPALLLRNLSLSDTWLQLFRTVSLLPLVALLRWPKLDQSLKYLLVTLAPLWIGMLFMGAMVRETRLELVPLTLVFIPAALKGKKITGALGHKKETTGIHKP